MPPPDCDDAVFPDTVLLTSVKDPELKMPPAAGAALSEMVLRTIDAVAPTSLATPPPVLPVTIVSSRTSVPRLWMPPPAFPGSTAVEPAAALSETMQDRKSTRL